MRRLLSVAKRVVAGRPPVGTTPHDVVARENKWRLLRYRREGAPVRYRTPVLLVPSLINRHYVLDLLPGRSLVEHLAADNLDVWMIDWGRPRAEDRYVSFDDVLDGQMRRAFEHVELAAGPRAGVSLLGYCMGGTLAAIFASLYPQRISALVCLTTPVDFSQGGVLSQWSQRENLDVDRIVDSLGNVPWPLMQASFHMLVPTSLAQKALLLYDRLGDDEFTDGFVALETWGNDNVDFPGEAYRRYIRELYQENRLLHGTLAVRGRPARLDAIRAPLLNVIAEGDHIVPPPSARCLEQLVSSDKRQTWELRGGHIGAIVSRRAKAAFWPRLSQWLVDNQRRG